ncbi:MAG: RNase adapter RapZ [Halocynthiibacter sp.]
MTEAEKQQMAKLVLVTGPSGAGRSTAIKCLEDVGFEAIDNMPLSLVPKFATGLMAGELVALGVDVRNRDFDVAGLIETVDDLTRDPNVALQVLYLDCASDVLVRRYSETRRRHPLAPQGTPQIGVDRERDLLIPIKGRANICIDTTQATVHDLRAEMDRWFAPKDGQRLAVSVSSFSYKRGIPRGVDMVFDCRFLRNPHWDPALKALDGRDGKVADYIAEDDRFMPFYSKVRDLVETLLPAYTEEGKAYLSIAFGCTGGQHRSVALTERLSQALSDEGWQVSTRHHEIERKRG